MKHYLDLIPISANIHRRQSRMTRICILLAVFLVSVIFGMADMEIKSQKIQAALNDGNWQAAFRSINDEQASMIGARPEVETSARYGVINYGLDKGYQLEGAETVICGFDEDLLHLFPAAAIVEGQFAGDLHSVVLSKGARDRLGLKLGDTVTLSLPSGDTLDYTVCGFTGDTSLLTEKDAIGMFMNTDSYRSLSPAGADHFYDSLLYVKFKPRCNIQKTLADIQAQLGLGEKQITQNVKQLALIAQSSDPYIIQLYMTATVLAVLVAIAGVLMIAGSLNSNIAQRTEFFGMMRCLGATKKQTIRFVQREALRWCREAIPLGLLAGIVVIWILCGILKFLSPGYFGSLPIFGVSWPGILSGILVGIFTVLLASMSPAKKAAGVSPLAAVSGNSGTIREARKAAQTNLFPVEIALGIHRARGSQKNFFLMTGSFAFSIILFLAFSPAVDFMHYSIRPLKPYSPDLSIISPDNSLSLPASLMEELSGDPAVKRAYGRSFAYRVPVTDDGRSLFINLVSYEDFQFGWADSAMLEGEIQNVMDGNSVLTVFHKDNPLTQDSLITIDTGSEVLKLPVSGILSDSPFTREPGVETVICSEELFRKLTGENGYTIIDIQLESDAADQDVNRIRSIAGDSITFSDKRLKNSEARGAYYSFALFVYGFLVVIMLISVFHIANSISMSVSAHIRQYGAMRAIGMSRRQLIRMVAAEAVTYGISGMAAGCAVGLPVHRLLFEKMITFRWGDPWYFPTGPLITILSVVACSILLAVLAPAKRIRNLSIVDTITAE